MALATHFSVARRKGGKGLGASSRLLNYNIKGWDEANVILAQQCCSRLNGSWQQHTRSTSFIVASNSWGLY